MSDLRSDAYDAIDHHLRNTLDDEDYAHYSQALGVVWDGDNDLTAKLQAAEAEVARLKQINKETLESAITQGSALRARIAELERKITGSSLYQEGKRTATEAALAWGWDLPWPTEGMTREQYIKRGLAALLGEKP